MRTVLHCCLTNFVVLWKIYRPRVDTSCGRFSKFAVRGKSKSLPSICSVGGLPLSHAMSFADKKANYFFEEIWRNHHRHELVLNTANQAMQSYHIYIYIYIYLYIYYIFRLPNDTYTPQNTPLSLRYMFNIFILYAQGDCSKMQRLREANERYIIPYLFVLSKQSGAWRITMCVLNLPLTGSFWR